MSIRRALAVSVCVIVVAMFTSLSRAGELVATSLHPSEALHNTAGAVSYGGQWFLWSGYSAPTGNHRTEKLEIYDPQSDSWSYGTDCPVERNGLTAFQLSGRLYSIGGEGHNAGTFSNAVHRYDPVTNSWEARANFPVNCWDRYGAFVDGTAYVFGGRSGYGATHSSMWEHDELADSWSSRASMLESTMHGVTAVVGGNLYAIGGNHRDSESSSRPTSAVQLYDPQSDTWEIVGDCPVDFNNGAGVAYDGTIYVFSPSFTDTVFCFDTAAESWSSLDFDYPDDWFCSTAAVLIDNKAYFAADDRVHFSAYSVTVPEPATMGLLAVGGLLLIRRRAR